MEFMYIIIMMNLCIEVYWDIFTKLEKKIVGCLRIYECYDDDDKSRWVATLEEEYDARDELFIERILDKS